MHEVFEELKTDKKFIEMVMERIYDEDSDVLDTLSEPEWFSQMTDIAEKYLMRFEGLAKYKRKKDLEKAELKSIANKMNGYVKTVGSHNQHIQNLADRLVELVGE
nr:MAG TPA: hypothetical protein [Caudoviricetes sp.]